MKVIEIFSKEEQKDKEIIEYVANVEFLVHSTLGYLPKDLHFVACMQSFAYNQQEIAQFLGCTQQNVSKMIKKIKRLTREL